MEEILKNNVDVAIWIIGILLSIIGILFSFVLFYIKSVFKETKGLSGKISKNNYSIIELKTSVAGVLSSLHSTEKGVWEELINLQRTVASGTMAIKQRREDIREIMDEQRRSERRMAACRKTLRVALQAFKQNRLQINKNKSEINLMRTKISNLGDNLLLIGEDKE